VLLFMINL